MEEAPTTFQALYYPFTRFRDETWLKRMSLYWEGVSRIVPHGVRPKDGDDARGLEEVGVLTSIRPNYDDLENVSFEFDEVLERNSDALVERYGIEQHKSWASDGRSRWSSSSTDPLAYIFRHKFNHFFVHQMISAGLAGFAEPGVGLARHGRETRHIAMHPRLADMYMVCLTEEIARRTASRPITDDLRAHGAVDTGSQAKATSLLETLVPPGPVQRASPNPDETLVAVAFDAVLPDLSGVPIEAVLEIRRQTAEQRFHFQRGIEAMTNATGLEGADLESVAREMERLYIGEIEPAIREIERSATRRAIRMVRQVFSLKTAIAGASTVVAAAAEVDDRLTVAAGMVGVAFGLNDAAAGWRDDQRRAEESMPVAAYLSRLEHLLPGGARSQKLLV